jgi:hypothetical protein
VCQSFFVGKGRFDAEQTTRKNSFHKGGLVCGSIPKTVLSVAERLSLWFFNWILTPASFLQQYGGIWEDSTGRPMCAGGFFVILNAYSILDFFVVILRLFLGVVVFSLAIISWKHLSSAIAPENRKMQEDRLYLLFLASFVLLALNVISWPLLYLVLQSYVSEWPEVMCIYGVTQIGTGSEGLSRFLPRLISILQFVKPALVFISGAWFVLYMVHRQSRTAPLVGRLLVLLMILGALAVGDALVEAAYLVIAKREVFVEAGCCTQALAEANRASRFLPQAMFGNDYQPWLSAAYYGVNLGMVLALCLHMRFAGIRPGRAGLFFLVLGAVVSLVINWIFLVEIASPALLHRPHHCPYDVLEAIPESVIGVALFLLGCFAVGWAACAAWLGNCSETIPALGIIIRQSLTVALFCYTASLMILSTDLALS